MSVVGLALIGMGAALGGAGWGLTRADRLTFGQGAQCVLGGGVLILLGLLLGLLRGFLTGVWAGLPGSAGVWVPDCLVLLLLLAAALGAWLRQAVLAARTTKQLRQLATDYALGAAGTTSRAGD